MDTTPGLRPTVTLPICSAGSSCSICYPPTSLALEASAPIDPLVELGLGPALDRCYLHDRTDCRACAQIAELELRAMAGDR